MAQKMYEFNMSWKIPILSVLHGPPALKVLQSAYFPAILVHLLAIALTNCSGNKVALGR